SAVEVGLTDGQAIVRHKAVSAAIALRTRIPFTTIADAITTLESEARFLPVRLSADQLWDNRNELPSSLAKRAIRYRLIEAIADSGEQRWVPWLEEAA